MNRAALLFALGLAACAAGPESTTATEMAARAEPAATVDTLDAPSGDPAFDAQAWLARVESALADSSARSALGVVRGDVWDDADDALGLERACNTYVDDGALVVDTTLGEGTESRRGLIRVQRLGGDEAVVTAMCLFGAYQGGHLLVHVEGDRAAVMTSLGDPGASDVRTPTLAEISSVSADRTVTTFAKARGLGDCGVFTRYRVGAGADLQTLEVRSRECSDDVPDEFAPETWPVVYRADR